MLKRKFSYLMAIIMLLSAILPFVALADDIAPQSTMVLTDVPNLQSTATLSNDPSPHQIRINGTFWFYSREHIRAPQVRTLVRNLPHVRIDVRYRVDGAWSSTLSVTANIDQNGNFTVNIPTVNGADFVELSMNARVGNNVTYITRSLDADRNPRGPEHAMSISSGIGVIHHIPGNIQTVEFATLASSDEPNRALNILMTLQESYEFLRGMGVAPPSGSGNPIPVVWGASPGPVRSTVSYYHSTLRYIHISYADNDHYSRPIIAHEYGHYVMWANIDQSLPVDAREPWGHARQHDPRGNVNPIFNFSEGWATFFGQSVLRDPRYLWPSGSSVNLEAPSTFNNRIDNNQWADAAAMWNLTNPINRGEQNPTPPNRPFRESWNTMLNIVNTPVHINGQARSAATLRDFYNSYFTNYITPNSTDAVDFWRMFNYHGRQFATGMPRIDNARRVWPGLSSGHARFEMDVFDNIGIGRMDVRLNNRHAAPAFVHDSIAFDRLNMPGDRWIYDLDLSVDGVREGRNSIHFRAFSFGRPGARGDGEIDFTQRPPVIFPPGIEGRHMSDDQNILSPEVLRETASNPRILPPIYGSYTYFFDNGDYDVLSRIGVVHGFYDNIGSILTSMGIDFDVVPGNQVNNFYFINQFDAIFINCAASMQASTLRRFVEEGGLVYASDLSGHSLQDAFPGHIGVSGSGFTRTVRANITDSGLAAHMSRDYMNVTIPGGGAVINPAQLTPDATIYLQIGVQSFAQEYEHTHSYILGYCSDHHRYSNFDIEPLLAMSGAIPLSASFRYGEGRVFFTAFHHAAQMTSDMTAFLEYLVFSMEHSVNEDNFISRAGNQGYEYLGAVFGNLDAGQTSVSFTHTPSPGNDFMLMLDSSMGNFTLRLTDPNGNAFSTEGLGVLSALEDEHIRLFENGQGGLFVDFDVANNAPEMTVISIGVQGLMVINPINGQWYFEVVSNNSIDNVAFAVGIAEKPQSPAISNVSGMLALPSGDNISVHGISPIYGRVYLLLVDDVYEIVYYTNFNTSAGEEFVFNPPSIYDGRYTLMAQAKNNNGIFSDINVIRVIVDATEPTIYINERFERTIFRDTVHFTGIITNGHSPEITVNGQSIPRWDIRLIAGSIPMPGEPSSLGFYTTLPLQEGLNEIVVAATGSGGTTTQKTVFISSDQTTPDHLRPTPRITYISIDDFDRVLGLTTVSFTVENSSMYSASISVFDGSEFLDITNVGGNNFTFVIDPDKYIHQDFFRSFEIQAVNVWGNSDWTSRSVFLEDWFLLNPPELPMTHTVTFNTGAHGHSRAGLNYTITTLEVYKGDNLNYVPPVIPHAGWQFVGWQIVGTEEILSISQVLSLDITENIMLMAKYQTNIQASGTYIRVSLQGELQHPSSGVCSHPVLLIDNRWHYADNFVYYFDRPTGPREIIGHIVANSSDIGGYQYVIGLSNINFRELNSAHNFNEVILEVFVDGVIVAAVRFSNLEGSPTVLLASPYGAFLWDHWNRVESFPCAYWFYWMDASPMSSRDYMSNVSLMRALFYYERQRIIDESYLYR